MMNIAAHAPKALVCWKMEKIAQIIQMVRLTKYTSMQSLRLHLCNLYAW